MDAGRHAPEAVHAVLTAAGQSPARSASGAADGRQGEAAERQPGEPAERRPGEADDRQPGQADDRQPSRGRPARRRASRSAADPQPTGRLAAAPAGLRPAGLSERECEVLSLLARGLATKQVARRLGISPKTCDHHIQRLYGKVGVSTRAGATLFALEHGLVHPDETVLR